MAIASSKTNKMRRKPVQARSQERVQRVLDVAEELFTNQGYAATTTKEIAAQAQIPIGSLYQFFPNKAAIVQALFVRYNDLLHQRLALFNDAELSKLPLSIFVDKLTDISINFYLEHPGYHKIYMEAQDLMSELDKIEKAVDAKLIRELVILLKQREAIQEEVNYEAIAYVLINAGGQVISMALGQEERFQQQLFTEIKRFSLSYLQSYFSSDITPANNSQD
ncbi:MAG: TetR/AcrR family transcriptional regulator [Leptolyngbya sp. SIO3F4]|nr:TetR/AcrR family transcriptional regulator [Leptolyngbya sp. SIO3F4]